MQILLILCPLIAAVATAEFQDPSAVAFACPFELNNCGFNITAQNGTNYAWKVGQGFQGNPYTTTGPMVDHTFYSPNGLFAYTNSGAGIMGSKTRLTSPLMACVGDQCCLEFYYHIYGQGPGTLNVVIVQPIFGENTLGIVGGQSLGSRWQRFRGTISPLATTFQFYIEATRSFGNAIIAIDDVAVYQESCPSTDEIYQMPFSCNFTIDMCGMYSSNQANISWSYQNGTTLSSSSGPTFDPYGGTSFVYVESAALSRERALLYTPPLDVSSLASDQCLEVSFYYHMFGRSMGALLVRMVAGSNSTLLFSRSGSAGNQWLGGYARAYASQIPTGTTTIQFYFEAVNVTSPSSNMALSGILIRPINCQNTTCPVESRPREALLSASNNISFTLLPGNTSQDCLNTCLFSSSCIAVTYDWAAANNCTLFFNESDALVTGVPSAITLMKRCIGQQACSVLVKGEYQTDGSYQFNYKPHGTPALVFNSNSASATDEMCQKVCSSRHDCVAVSYFWPYNGTCEIYTASRTTIVSGVVQYNVTARRRSGYPVGCPSSGAGLCGPPPLVPFLGYPQFSSVAVNSIANYTCNETNSQFAIGNGVSRCLANLTWSNPGVCQYQGLCAAGLSMLGLNEPTAGIGSLAYVFTSAKFTCSGVVNRWQIFVKNVDVPVFVDIWAPTASDKTYTLVSYHKFIPTLPGLQYFTPPTQVRVWPGYMIGYHYESYTIPSEALVIPHADILDSSPWGSDDLMDYSSGFFSHSKFSEGGTYTFQVSEAKARVPALRAFVVQPRDCTSNPSTPGGQVVAKSQGNSVGSVARFQCRGNYVMTGGSTSTCQADGTWTTSPACNHPGQTQGCGVPPTVSSGTPVYTSTSVGATVTYTCNQGFVGGIVSSATCQPDQTWGPDIPTCEVAESCGVGSRVIDSSTFTKPPSLWLVIFNTRFNCTGRLRRWTYWSLQGGIQVHFGVFSSVTASSGRVAFRLTGYSNVTTKGTGLETFDIPDTTVVNVTSGQFMGFFYPNQFADGSMGAIPVGQNGNLGGYTTADLANVWIYPYGANDILSASSFQFSSASYQTAYRIYPIRASVTVPPTQCSSPVSISNGAFQQPSSLTPGSSVTYSCNTNYVMVGESRLTCHALGYWTPAPPICDSADLCSVGVSGQQASGLQLATNLRIFSDIAFQCSGELRRWKFYAQVANVKAYLGVWRQNASAPNSWTLVGYNDYTPTAVGNIVYDVDKPQRIIVKAGDAIGVHYDSPFLGSASAVISMFQMDSAKGYEMAIGDGNIVNKVVTFAAQNASKFYVPSLFASIISSSGCSLAPAPSNGRVWQPNGTYATYTCNSGFQLVGSSWGSCSIAGTWPPAPLCIGQGGCVAGLSTLSNNTAPFSIMSAMLHVFTSITFSCDGKIIGWSFVSTTVDHVVYLSAWRNVGSGNYRMIGYNKVWATRAGHNYVSIGSAEQISVQANDTLGIFYQHPNMPEELLVVPYAGELELLRGIVGRLENGFMASFGQKQIDAAVSNTVNLGLNVRLRWRTPQVQAIIQS